jgi:hypothetical protein
MVPVALVLRMSILRIGKTFEEDRRMGKKILVMLSFSMGHRAGYQGDWLSYPGLPKLLV